MVRIEEREVKPRELNTVERVPLKKPKNLGNLGRPKEVSVVRNTNFEQ